MAYLRDSKSAAMHARLDYPVIDADGHWPEPIPIMLDYLRDVAGSSVAERYVNSKAQEAQWYRMTPQERLDRRQKRPTWWGAAVQERQRHNPF